MSTFHGLEMAKKALSAQQSALYTTGHNIANANTDGYSRQRVNFQTSTPYPSVGKNRPQIPGQVGTGVDAGHIERIRDEFLDKQYRSENSRAGYWSKQSDALKRMEELLNEPSDSGLAHTMNEFWNSLEELATNPDSGGAKSVVAQKGLAVAETFNYLSESLHTIQSDLHQELEMTAQDINSLLSQINQVNDQLKQIEPHGYVANDLYDKRDVLIDELSEMMNIHVTYDSAGGSAEDTAQGLVSIELVDQEGHSFEPPVTLLDGTTDYDDHYFNDFITLDFPSDDGALESIQFKDQETLAASELMQHSRGKLSSLVNSFGYTDGDDIKGHYPEMIQDLNRLAEVMADEFNQVHNLGGDYDIDFFVRSDNDDGTISASLITVNEEILDDPNLINANTLDDNGNEDQNGENARLLAEVFAEKQADLDDHSIESFYEHMISVIGVNTQEANRMKDNTEMLKLQVEEQRMSVSAVSLDEEMANMIKFQHAYNAAARSMTSIDELIDRIVNNMGLVGR